jgi:hypothetical protein
LRREVICTLKLFYSNLGLAIRLPPWIERSSSSKERNASTDPDTHFRAVFLDQDCLGQSPHRDRQIQPLCAAAAIHLVWQRPCHEAVLLHHLDGQTNNCPQTAADAIAELRRRWPDYRKASTARYLGTKLSLEDIWRACGVEPELRIFLTRIRYFPHDYPPDSSSRK